MTKIFYIYQVSREYAHPINMENSGSFILIPLKAKDLIPPSRFVLYYLQNFSKYINLCKPHITHLLNVDDYNKSL